MQLEDPEKVIAPTASPIAISIKLASLIFPGVPKLKACGFKNAEINKNGSKPTKLWKPATEGWHGCHWNTVCYKSTYCFHLLF